VDKVAIEKLKKVQHRGNVDRNDLVKVGHGKLDVAGLIGEEVELDEVTPIGKSSIAYALVVQQKDGSREVVAKDTSKPAMKKAAKKHGGLKQDKVFITLTAKQVGDKVLGIGEEVDLDEKMTFGTKRIPGAMKKKGMEKIKTKGLNKDKSSAAYIGKKKTEEVDLDEAPKYDLYHKDFSSAMQHAYKMAKKMYGITVDDNEIDSKVASGPKKPSEGKTNKYRLKGDKGGIQIQVYNKGGSKPYELNMYKEEVELDEALKVGSKINLPKGVGFWDTTNYPIGGKFGRVMDAKGLQITVSRVFKPSGQTKMSDTEGETKDGRKIAFKSSLVEEVELNERPYRVTNPDLGVWTGEARSDGDAAEKAMRKWGVRKGAAASRNFMKKTKVKKEFDALEAVGESIDEGKMSQLHQHIKDKKTPEEIAKIMKLDVKTIKALMDNFNESARSDAMRHMRRGSGVDPADIDVDASPEDIKRADKNIIMQLRGVVSLKGIGKVTLTPKQKRNLHKKDSKYLKTLGSGFVEFEKGHEKVDLKVAQAVLNKYNSYKRPVDKERFQTRVAKSYRDMLSALKESVVQESILERVNRQINEIKKLHEARPLGRWELANKKFSLVYDKGTYVLITQGSGVEKKLKAKTPQAATQELVKRGYRES